MDCGFDHRPSTHTPYLTLRTDHRPPDNDHMLRKRNKSLLPVAPARRCRLWLERPVVVLWAAAVVVDIITRHARITTGSTTTSTAAFLSSSPAYITKSQLTCLYQSPKNWDAILSDAEDSDGGDTTTTSTGSWWKQNTPYDMKYNQRNCERTNQNFKALQNAGGPGADIYGCVQPPAAATNEETTDSRTEGVFWFLGKVSHISDVSTIDAIRRLYPMIQQHAANLRPLDLFGPVTNQQLDLWYAPLHSEFDVAYNRPTGVMTKINPPTTETKDPQTVPAMMIKSSHVGFQGEIYEPGEEGFRTLRYTNDGTPCRPEITGPTDVNVTEDHRTVDDDDDDRTVPDDEQMEQIQKALEGKDINAIYEEQERRRRRATDTTTTEA